MVFAFVFVGILRQLRREADVVHENAESAIVLSAERGLTDWLAWATTLRGCAMADQGRHEAGIAEIEEGLAMSRATGAELFRPLFLCLEAKARMETDRTDEGLSALTEALIAADEHENRHYEAEIHRLRGELLLKQGDSNAAEAQNCFQRAIAIARMRSAKSWELRTTMSLARLLRDTGRREEARTMLADIYNWFTEGFDTADLKDARTLLEELAT
jgi:predicted ATPase